MGTPKKMCLSDIYLNILLSEVNLNWINLNVFGVTNSSIFFNLIQTFFFFQCMGRQVISNILTYIKH